MSQNFDNKIEEIVKLTDRNFVRKFVHVKDFNSFKTSMQNLSDSVNSLGDSELEQKSKECVEWIMERVNKWNMAIDNYHIVNKLKELLPLLKEINENLSDTKTRLDKEAEQIKIAKEKQARLAKEAEQIKIAKEKQERVAKEAEQARLAKEANDERLTKEVENVLLAEDNKNESFAKAVLKAQKNNEGSLSDDKVSNLAAE